VIGTVPNSNSLTILIIDDDPADQKLIKAALMHHKMADDLHFTGNAEEALDRLHYRGQINGSTRPDLILLDLNMPGMGGKEFLRQVKADSILKQIPVVILTTSNSETDISDTYQLQAAGYIRKPVTLDELVKVMGGLKDYWFSLCMLPCKEHR
jgi:CheY-like chemotaxis protein